MINNNNKQQYEKPTIALNRFRWVFLIIALVFVFYTFTLFDLQIIQGAGFKAQAEENRIRNISIPTQRGMIYDRNGILLARNIPVYNVAITPANLPESDGKTYEIFKELSTLLDIPVSRGEVNKETSALFTPCYTDFGITQIVQISRSLWPFSPTRVKCNVDKEVAMQVLEKSNDWPGVTVEIESIREYPTGETTAELIGFLGPIPEVLLDYYTEQGFVSGRDKVGYMGVENSLQSTLGGTNGKRVVEVNVGGEIIRDIEEPIEPIPGQDVHLTIDYRLQKTARESLASELALWNQRYLEWRGKILSTTGVVIAMNVKTGEILAMVSIPSYENNRMTQFIPGDYYTQLSVDEAKPLLNKAISSELPPGSVYKLATAIGALNEGVVTPSQEIDDPGRITLTQSFMEGDRFAHNQDYVCWDRDGHGPVNFVNGIKWSCNVYFYKVGGGYKDEVPDNGLGIWRMNEYAHALGYGQLTGIELPGEADGLLPNPTWKRLNQGENWATGDTYLASVGQGYVLATPLQVLHSIATIANDGKHMQVSLISKTTDSEGNLLKSFEPKMLWDITEENLIKSFIGNNPTGELKPVGSWVLDLAKRGMEEVTFPGGTASDLFEGDDKGIAGKTGTAEYCDDWANRENLCVPGNWPAHAWFVGYAPQEDPEIAVVAFIYNGSEGSAVGAPVVRRVIDFYFEQKAIDEQLANPGGN